MNTFDDQATHLEDFVDPGKDSPQEKKLPEPRLPQEDESLPVLPLPASRRAEAFLPEWLRRLTRG